MQLSHQSLVIFSDNIHYPIHIPRSFFSTNRRSIRILPLAIKRLFNFFQLAVRVSLHSVFNLFTAQLFKASFYAENFAFTLTFIPISEMKKFSKKFFFHFLIEKPIKNLWNDTVFRGKPNHVSFHVNLNDWPTFSGWLRINFAREDPWDFYLLRLRRPGKWLVFARIITLNPH